LWSDIEIGKDSVVNGEGGDLRHGGELQSDSVDVIPISFNEKATGQAAGHASLPPSFSIHHSELGLFSGIEGVFAEKDQAGQSVTTIRFSTVTIDQLVGCTHPHTTISPIPVFLKRVLVAPFLDVAESEFYAVGASPFMYAGYGFAGYV
jgi:hypothetical protein